MQIKCKFFPTLVSCLFQASLSPLIPADPRRMEATLWSFASASKVGLQTYHLGYDLHQRDWDAKRRKVKKSYEGVSSISRLNHELQHKKTQVLDALKELEEQDLLAGMSVQEIKKHLTREENTSSFFFFTQSLIQDFRKVQRFGNAASYTTVLSVLKTFVREQRKADLEFKEVTYSFLKRFENWHLAKGKYLQ